MGSVREKQQSLELGTGQPALIPRDRIKPDSSPVKTYWTYPAPLPGETMKWKSGKREKTTQKGTGEEENRALLILSVPSV